MSKLNDEYIEEAFAKVRANFESRDNEFGLEMLDGCEAQWNETGHQSDGQLEWLERQLDGSWQQAPKSPSLRVVRGGATRKPGGGSHNVQATSQASNGSLDALIREKLAAQGEVVIDLARLDELEAAADDLKRAVKALKNRNDARLHGCVREMGVEARKML